MSIIGVIDSGMLAYYKETAEPVDPKNLAEDEVFLKEVPTGKSPWVLSGDKDSGYIAAEVPNITSEDQALWTTIQLAPVERLIAACEQVGVTPSESLLARKEHFTALLLKQVGGMKK